MSGELHFTAVVDQDDELEKKPESQLLFLGRPVPIPGAEPTAPEAAPEAEAEPEIEVVYERPNRGRDAIEELQEQYEAVKREKAEAEQVAMAERQWRLQTDEALARARDRDAIAAEHYSEGQRIEDAKARYANASYYGRHAEMAEIAEELAARAQYKKQLEGAHENLSQMAVLPPPPQQQPADPLEHWLQTAGANLLPEDKDYLRSRRSFIEADGGNPALLQSAAVLAERRYGLTPGTPEYHQHIDEAIGLADQAQPVKQARRQQGGAAKRPVAAPGSRASGRSPQGRVHLSDYDIAQAKMLNISLKDMAAYKQNANKGQYGKSVTGGRLHASYTVNSFEDHY